MTALLPSNCPPATIKVFREDPMWDADVKWFKHPLHRLEELYVATYEMGHDELPTQADIDYVRALHPNCVLLYV